MTDGPRSDADPWDASVGSRFRRGISWATVGTALGFPATLAVSALVARLLEPEAVGRYFAIISFVMVGSLVTALGLHQTALREVSRAVGLGQPRRAQEVLRTSRRIVAITGLVALLGVLVADAVGLATPLTGARTQPLLAFVVGLILVAKTTLLLESSALRGLHDYSSSSVLATAAPHTFTAVLLGMLVVAGADVDLPAAILATLIGVALSAGIARWRWRRRLRAYAVAAPSRPSASSSARTLLGESLPVWGFTVLRYALTVNVDLLILAAFRPLDEVAVYGAAARLAQLVGSPALVFNTSSAPLIAELHVLGDKQRLEKVTRTSATLGSIPVAAGTLVALLVGSQLLGLVFGEVYRAGATIFVILCAANLISVAFGQGGSVLMMTGHQRRLVTMTAVSASVYLVGAVVAVVVWGAVALALTSLAALALQNIGNWALVRRHVGVPTHVDIHTALALGRRPFTALRQR